VFSADCWIVSLINKILSDNLDNLTLRMYYDH
jgi:hypothetical protein